MRASSGGAVCQHLYGLHPPYRPLEHTKPRNRTIAMEAGLFMAVPVYLQRLQPSVGTTGLNYGAIENSGAFQGGRELGQGGREVKSHMPVCDPFFFFAFSKFTTQF